MDNFFANSSKIKNQHPEQIQNSSDNESILFNSRCNEVDFINEKPKEISYASSPQEAQIKILTEQLAGAKNDFAIERKKLLRKIETLENDLLEIGNLPKLMESSPFGKVAPFFIGEDKNPSPLTFSVNELEKVKAEKKQIEALYEDLRKENFRLDGLCRNYFQIIEERKIEDNFSIRDLEIKLVETQSQWAAEKAQAEKTIFELQNKIEYMSVEFQSKTEHMSQEFQLKTEKMNTEFQAKIEQTNSEYSTKITLQNLESQAKVEQMSAAFQAKVKEMNSEFYNKYESMVLDYETKIKNQDQLLTELKYTSEESRHRMDHLSKELVEKNNLIAYWVSKESQVAVELHLLNERSAQDEKQLSELKFENENLKCSLDEQREQFKEFAKYLNRKKNEVSTHVQFLLSEYGDVAMAHPLQDYLDFTEQELVRVEFQLRKTPTVSVDRNHLEQTLQKLTEQKEFLETVIKKRKLDLELRAKKLKEMLEKSTLDLVPPPPPAPPMMYKLK